MKGYFMKKEKKMTFIERKLAPVVEAQMFISWIIYKELCEFNGIECSLENFVYNYSTIAKEIHQECYHEESVMFHDYVNKKVDV